MTLLDVCVEHIDVVNTLACNLNEKTLDQDIKNHLRGEFSRPIAFQLKMEVLRQNKKSIRPIRSYSINEKIKTSPHTLGGVEHHLDLYTLKYFKSLIKVFRSQYTVGVEERVLNYIKKNQEEIIQSQINDDLKCFPINLSEKIYRSEERMFLGVRGEVAEASSGYRVTERPNTTYFKDHPTPCTTQNISNGGIKIKTNEKGSAGHFYFLRLTGLEKEFSFEQPLILYKLIQSVPKKTSGETTFEWLMSKCESEHHAEFNIFLSRLIRSNSGRYRVDIDNILRSATNSITEQFVTNRQTELALFFDENKLPVYAYGSNVSHATYKTYENECKSNVFAKLVEKDDLINSHSSSFFWVTIKTAKNSFFSAPLTDNPVNRHFFHVAMGRPNSTLFKVERSVANTQNAYLEPNLPPKTKDKNAKIYCEQAREEVRKIRDVLVFTELDKSVLPAMTSSKTKQAKYGFAEFSYKCSEIIESPIFIRASNNELRKEDRFQLKTKVIFKSPEFDFEGHTSDISISGLSVNLGVKMLGYKGSEVVVTFPELSNERGAAQQARYTIVEVEDDGVRLVLVKGAKSFLSTFIKENRQTLPLLGIGNHPAGLDRALRNIFNSTMTSIKGLIRTRNGRASVPIVNIPSKSKQTVPFANFIGLEHKHCELSKEIFHLPKLQELLTNEQRNIGKGAPFKTSLFVLGIKNDDDKFRVGYHAFWDTKTMSLESMSNLLGILKRKGLMLSVFQLKHTKKARIFDLFYRDELNYIERHAPHKHKDLCDLSHHTNGVFSLTPVDEWFEFWSEAV